MDTPRPLQVFISSTSVDLSQHRSAVADQLRRMRQMVLLMEEFGSRTTDAISVCADEIENCDLFIGLYAFRYGYAPVDSGTSITELEYGIARQLGKRCLCYFADETLRSDLFKSDEPEWKVERLTKFKKQIDAELVRSTFTSPDDLGRKLAVDLNRILLGEPLGYSFKDVRARWFAWEKNLRAYLPRDIMSRSVVVDSPLQEHWVDFINQLGWHSLVANLLNTVQETASRLPEFSELARRAQSIELNASYPEILQALGKQLVTNAALDSVRKLIGELQQQIDHGSADSTGFDRHRKACQLHQTLTDLQKQLQTPTFHRCFLIMGGMGAGKTHFAVSLLANLEVLAIGDEMTWREREDFLLLPLQPPSYSETLLAQIEQGIRAATQLHWRNLAEFDQFLEESNSKLVKIFHPAVEENEEESFGAIPQPAKLVVVLDDVSKWLTIRPDFKKELIASIVSLSQYHSLYWLMTMPDTCWEDFAGRGDAEFWLQYSYADYSSRLVLESTDASARVSPFAIQAAWTKPLPHSGGWLDLDKFNEMEGIGLALLQKALEPKTEEDKRVLHSISRTNNLMQGLLSPFIAWVIVELYEQPSETSLRTLVTDPIYIQFVDRFWAKRHADLMRETSTLSETLFDQFIYLLAQVLAKSGDLNPLRIQLIDAIQAEARGRSELTDHRDWITDGLEVLNRGSLLQPVTVRSSISDWPEVRVVLRFEPFWQWRLAKQLQERQAIVAQDVELALHELSAWFRSLSSREIKDGVLQFLLQILDQKSTNAKYVRDLWCACLTAPDIPYTAGWHAAPKASDTLQRELVAWTPPQPDYFAKPGALFAYLGFISDASRQVLSFPERLRLLQPHYRAMHEAGLASQFLSLVDWEFRLEHDNTVILASLPYFSASATHLLPGCEMMRIAPTPTSRLLAPLIAKSAIDMLDSNTDGDHVALLDSMMKYLTHIGERAQADYQLHPSVRPWQRYFFREWLLFEFCDKITRKIGIDAYTLLAERGWYQAQRIGIDQRIAREMEREANIALGFCYRRGYDDIQSDFVDLVTELGNSRNPKDRENAFHLIRHTEPTGGEKRIQVDNLFRPLLRQLFLDFGLTRTVDVFYTFFEINLPDFEELEQKRLQRGRRRRRSSR